MKILTFRQFINENLRGTMFSIRIMNLLFHDKKIDQLYDKLKPNFPIDHNDIQKIIEMCNIAVNTPHVTEEFAAHEDYALTILNKFFINNNTDEMKAFLFEQCKVKVNDLTIENIYNKFHSSFN
jgi:hypothetical protein